MEVRACSGRMRATSCCVACDAEGSTFGGRDAGSTGGGWLLACVGSGALSMWSLSGSSPARSVNGRQGGLDRTIVTYLSARANLRQEHDHGTMQMLVPPHFVGQCQLKDDSPRLGNVVTGRNSSSFLDLMLAFRPASKSIEVL